MTPRKTPSLSSGKEERDTQLDRLIEAVETVAMELQILGKTVEGIREDIQWLTRNPEQFRRPAPIMHITSMPLDPLAEDFGAEVNRLKPEDVPATEAISGQQSPPSSLRHRDLFD